MTKDMQDLARYLVWDYADQRLGNTDSTDFAMEDVYIVWFSKVLQNWKALVSTTMPDGVYYEVTYDGDKKQTYLDVYKKFDNVVIES